MYQSDFVHISQPQINAVLGTLREVEGVAVSLTSGTSSFSQRGRSRVNSFQGLPPPVRSPFEPRPLCPQIRGWTPAH
jgi:hypothetical protein